MQLDLILAGFEKAVHAVKPGLEVDYAYFRGPLGRVKIKDSDKRFIIPVFSSPQIYADKTGVYRLYFDALFNNCMAVEPKNTWLALIERFYKKTPEESIQKQIMQDSTLIDRMQSASNPYSVQGRLDYMLYQAGQIPKRIPLLYIDDDSSKVTKTWQKKHTKRLSRLS